MLFTESERKKTNAKKRAAHAASQLRPDHCPRILVVEDDCVLRLMNTEVLISSGYQVDAADSGASAWSALQTNGYDLVVTDNNMPKVTGVELVAKIHAAGLNVPVIMATGSYPTDEFERSPELRPAFVLLKPYDLGELLDRVTDVLAAAAAARHEAARSLANGVDPVPTECDFPGQFLAPSPVYASVPLPA